MLDEWESKPLAEIVKVKISYGIVQAGPHVPAGIPYIKSSDLRGDLSPEALQRTSKEIHYKYRRSSVHPGDIVFSLRGNIGESAIVPETLSEANLTQGTARISVADDQCNVFYYYQLASEKLLNRINRLSKGSTFKEISLEELRKVKVLCPPLPDQKRIARTLSVWDKSIIITEQLLANSQHQKKALMQQLLTGKRRLLDKDGSRFSGEWRRVELGLLLDYKQPTPFLVDSTDYSDAYEVPVLTAGKTFVLGYTNEDYGVYSENLPAIIFDDFTTASKFVDFPFKAKSSAMKILTAKPEISIKYVFEAMQMLKFAVGGHQRHWISIYSNLVIPMPEEEEQLKIAEVLATADREIDAIERRLDALKLEKTGLMQQLLTGKRRLSLSANL